MGLGDFLVPTLQRIACGLYGSVNGNPYQNDPILTLPPGLGGGIRAPLGGVGDAITRWACALGPPPGSGDPQPNPYRPIPNRNGGYCNTAYTMTVVWNYKLYPSGDPTNNPPQGSAVIPITGPISGLYTDGYPSPNLIARNSAGTTFVVNGISNDALDYGEILSVSFVRDDGLPDNCQPPGLVPVAPPITVPDPRGPLLPPIVIVPLAPVFITPITPTLNFNVDIGGVEFNLNVDINTGDTTVLPPGEVPANCCVPKLRSPPSDPIDPEDQGPDLQYIAGIHTRIVVNEPNTFTQILAESGGQNIFAPRLGSISFKVRAGSKVGWTPDIDIKHLRQWTAVPGDLYATDYQVISGYNVSIQASPVYYEPPYLTT
jgi:hypothetical protein